MLIIILGAGKTGFSLAQNLLNEGKQVVIIEKNREKAAFADSNLDCQIINDYGNNRDVLVKAGIQKADFFIALTESDEINMITCALVSSEFKKPTTMARVRNIDYNNSPIASGEFLGINHIINPEIELANTIIKTIEHGARSEIMTFEKTQFQIRDLSVSSESIFTGKQIKQIRQEVNTHFLIAAILRDSDYIIPDGEATIHENDILYILSTEKEFEKIFTQEGNKNKPIKNILLIGGGKTGSYVADYLFNYKNGNKTVTRIGNMIHHGKKRSLHIVEEDYKRCKFLAERYPEAIITHSDISDEGFLEEEDLSNFDLMINITGSQELNIIAGVYGKNLGIPRTLSVVKKNSYRNICKTLNVDVTISKKNSVVSSIMKIIRKGDIRNVYAFSDAEIEALEIFIKGNSAIAGIKIKDLKLPKDILILFISRNGESYIPTGEMVISAGDNVGFICTKKSIKRLEKLISEK
jgi:trk system potassium uptake protein TrkA